MIGRTVGHYRIETKLGEGGMGVVYAARDERLRRPVAVKMIHGQRCDPQFRDRLWREARAAAAVNHPNICQIYELGEETEALFIVMELLEGESLARRLRCGPLAVEEAVSVGLGILSGLEALQRQRIVHRDLKPSNVFLTTHGVKLVDFGLAKPLTGMDAALEAPTGDTLTQSGVVVGTPQYMSPEHLQGQPTDSRSDIFAAGTILFEMVAGEPAFAGKTIAELFHAIVYEPPKSLTGAAAILDDVVRGALAKNPDDRFPTAEAMANQLRSVLAGTQTKAAPRGRPATRLIVLPFYQLRPDEETAFLCFSLPDAISSSLAGLHSLVVRSSRVAARFGGSTIDLKSIAAETEVDAVMTGTMLRAGDQLRISTQLVEAPSGTLLRTHSAQVALVDIFRLQDELVQRIVQSLALPLTERERSLMRRDVPGSARAYEFYLRANQLAGQTRDLALVRDLYERCLDEDPMYAPAWARVARCYRVLGKYGINPSENLARAEEAFQRAFALNPDLPTVHKLYTPHETENGRAKEAIVRLLGLIQRNRNDPELYAGLVYACRYAGLLEASLKAHELARRVDRNVDTSVSYTHFAMGNYQVAIESSAGDPDSCRFDEIMALDALGRRQEASERLRRPEDRDLFPLIRLEMRLLKAFLDRDRKETVELVRKAGLASDDPETFFCHARMLARVGETTEALTTLHRAVRGGFYCAAALLKDFYLEPVRAEVGFTEVLHEAEMLSAHAQAAFVEAGGEHLLAATSDI